MWQLANRRCGAGPLRVARASCPWPITTRMAVLRLSHRLHSPGSRFCSLRKRAAWCNLNRSRTGSGSRCSLGGSLVPEVLVHSPGRVRQGLLGAVVIRGNTSDSGKETSGPVAQAVEHCPFKARVLGSSPSRLTNCVLCLTTCPPPWRWSFSSVARGAFPPG